MRGAQHGTVREALHEEMRPLVLVRLQRILCIGIAGLILSAISDLRLGSQAPYDLIGVKLAGSGLQGLAALLVARARTSSWRHGIGLSVVAWSLSCAVVSFNGLYTGDPMMPTLLLPMMAIGAAMVFPWSASSQAAYVAIVSLVYLPHVAAFGTNLIVSVYSVFAASIYVAGTFERQQLERKAIELLQTGQQRVLEQIAVDAPLAEIARRTLEIVSQQAPDLIFALGLLDDEAHQLRCVAAIDLPDGYRQALESMPVSSCSECIAVAALNGKPAVSSDHESFEGVPRLAQAHDLRSSWAEPIVIADRAVVGAIAAYRKTAVAPRAGEKALLVDAARLIGIGIERRHARQQVERYLEALDGARIQAEKQAEQLQEQAAQLAEARDQALASVRARSQFLANMSHEIRTPLNGIIGTTEILLDSDLSSSQREYTRILSQCGEHLLGVVNDILDLSKIEAGKVEIERLPFDLQALLEDVADVLATKASQKGIELVTSIPPDFDANVKGDAARLRQVLVNLIGNAIKFTERGEVVVEAQVLEESSLALRVRVSVRDTGIGIAPERQGSVFESFTQGDGSTTRTYGGTGLGLTISRQLIRMMGGEIGLESTLGAGSTFWIELSLERAPAAEPRVVPPADLARLRVLVVDDTAVNRLILRRFLQAWGCRVEEATSGREALALLDGGNGAASFGLVLLDMRMPELDGVQTAQHIKANPALAPIPLILLSSIGGLRGGAREARENGFAAAITKPVRQSALLSAILHALGEIAAVPEQSAEPARIPTQSLDVLRVLLAEDNHVNQLVARRLLERLGCHVEIVDNGEDAVEAAARNRYDLILMDIQMPRLDGYDATTRIRSTEHGGHRVPIVAMTAHAMEGDRERCLAAGMDDYVAKPVTLSALAKMLVTLKERSHQPAAATPSTVTRHTQLSA